MLSSMLRYSLVLLGFIPMALGYSSGAPTFPGVCRNLIPGHGEAPQTGVSPFTIIGPSTAEKDSTVNLTLDGDTTNFKGFMVRAFELVDHENNAYEISDNGLGQFQEISNGQLTTCDNTDDTATHKKNQAGELESKTNVEMTWKAPNYATWVAFRSTACIGFTIIHLNDPTYMEIV